VFFDSLLKRQAQTAKITPVTLSEKNQIYFKMLAIHIAVSYIANTISKCEFKVFENGQEVHNDLYYRLNVSANPNQNAAQLKNQIVWRMFINQGGSLVLPYRDCIYSADGYQIEEHPITGDIYKNITVGNQDLRKNFKAEDVVLLKLDDKGVKALIDGAFDQYEKALSTAFLCYKSGNGVKYKYTVDTYPGGTEQFNKDYKAFIASGLTDFIDSYAGVLPMMKGTDLTSVSSQAQSSADIIALRKDVFSMTAQSFKIPESMMYGNITNTNDVVQQFLTFGVDPYANIIGQEFTRKYYTMAQWQKRSYVQVDTSTVLHVDILEIADKVDKIISSAALSVNEVRTILGEPPIDEPWANTHWMTKNNSTAEEQLKNPNGGGEKK